MKKNVESLVNSTLEFLKSAVDNQVHSVGAYVNSTGKLKWQLEAAVDKGALGEYTIFAQLKEFAKSGARILFNLYIPTGDGEYTEIDVLMVTSRGLIVVESKNYAGWIFGNEADKEWTVTYPSKGGAKKFKFYNPVKQNQGHAHALRVFLEFHIPVYPIVVFSDKCTFKQVSVHSMPVIYVKNLRTTVHYVFASNAEVIDSRVVKLIYDDLLPYARLGDEVKEEHIKRVKELQGRR